MLSALWVLSSSAGIFRANNAIDADGELARAFGAHEFAAGYGGRWR